jgi:putative nucleotidyltransferase with HDIG domain
VDVLARPMQVLDRRDRTSARHRLAVAQYSLTIAAAAGLPPRHQELVHRAALYHDLGKILLPQRILEGAGALSDAEWELVRAHPVHGGALVTRLSGDADLALIVATHHERLDGGGYPRGLKGAQIPALARIVAVAEAYDAMTAQNGYRRPLSSRAARRCLSQAAGTQLEPRFVELLVGALAGGGVR